MLKNYLLIAIRNIKKYKTFSALNILGLAVSMSICLVVILFVNQQKSYDRFHEHADRIYRVITSYKFKSMLLNHMLLQDFAYRVEIGLAGFAFAILLTLSLALVTIGSQTLKAALTNPTETLREE